MAKDLGYLKSLLEEYERTSRKLQYLREVREKLIETEEEVENKVEDESEKENK